MKKLIISMLMIASCFGVANAQLSVDRLGKVAVGYESTNANDTLYSNFTIGSRGSSIYKAYIESEGYGGLMIKRDCTKDLSGDQFGIRVTSTGTYDNYNYGVCSWANGGGANRRNIGVFGFADSDTTGYEAGIIGVVDGNNANGVGVLGSTEGRLRTTSFMNRTGSYAGYFMGDTRVTGTMTAGAFVTSSDYRLKKNVRSLSSSDGCLDKLMDMNVVEFNNRQREYEMDIDALGAEETDFEVLDSNKELMNGEACWYKKDSPILKNKHYGLIAQELQEIYPDLVVESQDGFLAINYLEIIPLLIRSVQELKAELDAAKSNDTPIQKAQARNTDVSSIDAVVTTLYQNTPNPFTESTLIQCDVAETVVNADLYIYDMNGKQIDTYPITERGATSITIEGRSLEAGMYLYALIADGQVIDTKRMILTK